MSYSLVVLPQTTNQGISQWYSVRGWSRVLWENKGKRGFLFGGGMLRKAFLWKYHLTLKWPKHCPSKREVLKWTLCRGKDMRQCTVPGQEEFMGPGEGWIRRDISWSWLAEGRGCTKGLHLSCKPSKVNTRLQGRKGNEQCGVYEVSVSRRWKGLELTCVWGYRNHLTNSCNGSGERRWNSHCRGNRELEPVSRNTRGQTDRPWWLKAKP